MDVVSVMAELESLGSPQTRAIHIKHGASENIFGVKVGDMKKILKKTKKNHGLAKGLYDTGNGDAMYLAMLMASEKEVTPAELDAWVEAASSYSIAEYGVAGVAAESPHGWEMAQRWIEDDRDRVRATGWATLGHLVSIRKDEKLDIGRLAELLDSVRDQIHDADNRTRYTMNGFVIAVGSYVAELTAHARTVAEAIGKVRVDMGGTACKVPLATEAIDKIINMDRVGKKRKHARC